MSDCPDQVRKHRKNKNPMYKDFKVNKNLTEIIRRLKSVSKQSIRGIKAEL